MSSGDENFDCKLLIHGGVTLYWRMELLDAAADELRKLGYDLIRLPLLDLHRFKCEFSTALGWRKLFGYHPWTGNLDALNDALRARTDGSRGNVAIVQTDNPAYHGRPPGGRHPTWTTAEWMNHQRCL